MSKKSGIHFYEILFLTFFSFGGVSLFLLSPKQALKNEASVARAAEEKTREVADSLQALPVEELQKRYAEAVHRFEFKRAYRLILALESKNVPVLKEKKTTLFKAFLFEGEPVKFARTFQEKFAGNIDSTDAEEQAMKLMTRFYVSQGPPMQIIRTMLPLAEKAYYANLALGLWAIKSGQTEKAFKRLKKATELNPTTPEAYYFLHILYARKGEKELAEVYKKKALSYFYSPNPEKLKNLEKLLN